MFKQQMLSRKAIPISFPCKSCCTSAGAALATTRLCLLLVELAYCEVGAVCAVIEAQPWSNPHQFALQVEVQCCRQLRICLSPEQV